MPSRRILTGTQCVKAAVKDWGGRRRYPSQRQDRAEPEPLERRQGEAARRLCKMGNRVGAEVPVLCRVGERSDTARIEYDYKGARHAEAGANSSSERSTGENTA